MHFDDDKLWREYNKARAREEFARLCAGAALFMVGFVSGLLVGIFLIGGV